MCIGIVPWGNIYNRKQLGNAGSTVVYEKFSNISNRNNRIEGESLNKHHTHFFLVDDGYVNKPDGEMEFRGNLERAVQFSGNTWKGNSWNYDL